MKRFEYLNLDYPVGCIIAKASLVDCVKIDNAMKDILKEKNYLIYKGVIEDDDWNGYGFKLENIEKLNLVPVNGKLGLWEYTEELNK